MASHSFSLVPDIQIQRSTMDRSTHVKTTFNESYIVPIFLDEVLPGDTFSIRATIFMRLITLISPIMDNLWLQTFWFWAPMRILWDKARYFWGEQYAYAALTAQPDWSIPQVMSPDNGASAIEAGSMADYFGLPLTLRTGLNCTDQECSALPFRMYNKIYNRFFRDQNLQDPVDDNYTSNGADQMEDYNLQKACKFHDYFTSCLPWPQKGDPIQMPIGESALVYGTGDTLTLIDGTNAWLAGLYQSTSDEQLKVSKTLYGDAVGTAVGTPAPVASSEALGAPTKAQFADGCGLYADLSEAVAANINDLRLSIALQRMLEKDSRFGTRYAEFIKGHFGVDMIDAAYEPTYLGGTRQRVSINPVTKTYETEGDYQVGDLRATGVLAGSDHIFTRSFQEHGYIMGLMVLRGDLTYHQGIAKLFTRELKEDFYDPSMSNIGEQPVLNQELCYIYNNVARNKQTFGYQEPWAEYRYKPAILTGLMRPSAPLGLSTWTLAENFNTASPPDLDSDFIKDNVPVSRVLAITNQDHCKADIKLDIVCARPMPLYSVPGMMDHF